MDKAAARRKGRAKSFMGEEGHYRKIVWSAARGFMDVRTFPACPKKQARSSLEPRASGELSFAFCSDR
jgi:hypothetical protein